MGILNLTGTARLLLLLLGTASSTCYWPNGDVYSAPDHAECPNTPACCAINRSNPPGGNHTAGEARDECLSNGLCQNRVTETDGSLTQTYWLVACKHKDWAGNCLDVCNEELMQMTPCDGTNASTTWCCGATNECCTEGSSARKFVAAIFTPSPSPSTTFSSTSASSIATQIASSASKSTEPPSSTNSPAPSNRALSTGAKAGIGIGAVVGALVIFGAGFFVAKSLRWKKKADAASRGQPAEQKNIFQDTHSPPAWNMGQPPEMGGAEYFEAASVPRHEVCGIAYHEAGGVPYYEAGGVPYYEAGSMNAYEANHVLQTEQAKR